MDDLITSLRHCQSSCKAELVFLSCRIFVDLLTLATSRKYFGNDKLERFVPAVMMPLRSSSGEHERILNLIGSFICSSRYNNK